MVKFGGIYKIENRVTGDCYIGSAVNFIKRARVHKHLLNKGKHDCIHLQRAVAKYGPSNFCMKPLLVCRREDLLFFEQRAIDIFNPAYNIQRVAGSNLGKIYSTESRAKMSAAKIGRKQSPEHRASISAALKGKPKAPFSPSHIEKLRISHLGRTPGNKGKKKVGNTYE